LVELLAVDYGLNPGHHAKSYGASYLPLSSLSIVLKFEKPFCRSTFDIAIQIGF
jgi:hypothetical protein